jgi:hypothetical protein
MTAPAAKAKSRHLRFKLEGLLIADHRGKRFMSAFIVLTSLSYVHVFQ